MGGDETNKEAGEGGRTLDNNVGNVVLYLLSYTRSDFYFIFLFHEGQGKFLEL